MKYLHPRKILRLTKEKLHDWFWYYLLPDNVEISYVFRKRLGYKLNLNNPLSFNEKIQWLKLNDHNPRYPDLIDKLKVKDILTPIIGKDHIIPTLLGPYYNVEDIPWDKLPMPCVIKCNHDAASTMICSNPDSFNIKLAKEKFSFFLNRNYYHYEGKQWGYKTIKPCIFIEQYMQNGNDVDLEDYKFLMFNGKCKCLFTCTDRRAPSGMRLNFYTPDWRQLPFTRDYPNTDLPLSKPGKFKEMLEMAEIIANFTDNSFVRVDLYEINGQVYFGELTFYPGGGFEAFQPIEWDYTLGSWIDLSRGAK